MLKQHSLKIPFRFHDYNQSGPCCFSSLIQCVYITKSHVWHSLASFPSHVTPGNEAIWPIRWSLCHIIGSDWQIIGELQFARTLYIVHIPPVSHKAIFHHRHKQKALGYYVAERSLLSYLEVAEIGNMCPTAHVRINTWEWTRLESTTLIKTKKITPKN